jgi:hypothetical protein
VGVLRGDPSGLVRTEEVVAFTYGQREGTRPEPQVKNLDAGAPVFQQGILTHDAQLTDPVLHIRNDIGRLGKHYVNICARYGQNQPSARVAYLGTVNSGFFKQLQSLFLQPPLGQG